ncbi:MAG: hypothetical protein ACYC6N_16635 [Pirellulaceae bacterium]
MQMLTTTPSSTARQKVWSTVLSLMVGSLVLVSAAAADERPADNQSDQLRERAEAREREVHQLHQQGKHDEAQRLEREVAELREQAERMSREGHAASAPSEAIANRLRELSQQWIDAMGSEQRDRAERLEQEIHDIARDTGARVQEIMRPQLEMMERKIDELREQDQPELAERLAGQLREMVEAHQRAAAEQREQAEAAAGEARERGKSRAQRARAEAAEGEARERAKPRAQRERTERPEGRPGPRPDERAEMERRMHHLQTAAENLNAIGMHEVAERLNRQVEEIQQMLENPPSPQEDPRGAPGEHMQEELRRVHQRLDELSRRLEELAEQVKRDR